MEKSCLEIFQVPGHRVINSPESAIAFENCKRHHMGKGPPQNQLFFVYISQNSMLKVIVQETFT